MKPPDRFSDEVAAVLRSAGWFPGRHVSVEGFAESIQRVGATAGDRVLNFLGEFGGLLITYSPGSANSIRSRPDQIRLDPAFARGYRCDDYEAIIGQPICPIGDAYDGHMTLLMSNDGAIYGVYDQTVVRLGLSSEESMETIIQDLEPTPISL